mgnify:FL=1
MFCLEERMVNMANKQDQKVVAAALESGDAAYI